MYGLSLLKIVLCRYYYFFVFILKVLNWELLKLIDKKLKTIKLGILNNICKIKKYKMILLKIAFLILFEIQQQKLKIKKLIQINWCNEP